MDTKTERTVRISATRTLAAGLGLALMGALFVPAAGADTPMQQ